MEEKKDKLDISIYSRHSGMLSLCVLSIGHKRTQRLLACTQQERAGDLWLLDVSTTTTRPASLSFKKTKSSSFSTERARPVLRIQYTITGCGVFFLLFSPIIRGVGGVMGMGWMVVVEVGPSALVVSVSCLRGIRQ